MGASAALRNYLERARSFMFFLVVDEKASVFIILRNPQTGLIL
jgi:hypothetical protein